MFRAWKHTILTHYRLFSGKGLKNEKYKCSTYSTMLTLSFFCAPCNLAEGPLLGNLGL